MNFFESQPTEKIAQALLGATLSYQKGQVTYKGIIVETEAYLGVKDQASHVANGHATKRTQALYQPGGGRIYVYTMRGLYLLNITTQKSAPECVLIRAIEPLMPLVQIQKNRQGRYGRELTNGPGKLCQAIDLKTLGYNGQLIGTAPIDISFKTKKQPLTIATTARVGIPGKEAWTTAPLRYYVVGNPYVSKIFKSTIDFKTKGWV